MGITSTQNIAGRAMSVGNIKRVRTISARNIKKKNRKNNFGAKHQKQ
jgi:hypothetical protein